jgi:hypothetical protein
VNAYKFLRSGAVGPFTGFRWHPGTWVEADAASPCESGIHACRVEDLPFWTGDELWEVELDGDVVVAGRKVVAPRGRLVRRVEVWSSASAQELAAEATARTRSLSDARRRDRTLRGYAEDAALRAGQGKAYVATYIAAVAAEYAGGPPGREAERAAQVDWFARLLAS